jgi:UDP-N-acetylmuramyl pentapeptide phosphotransferase/UDP-N-acetylglucosamine-1-phosphate transferase
MFFSFLLILGLFISELLYFQIANRFSIIDKPNERSSHTLSTIRGGGIIFPLAWFSYVVISGGQFLYVTTGLVLISVVSLWDDVSPLNNWVRLIAHLIAFALCFYELGLWTSLPVWVMVLLFIGCIGALNIVNFMDGINGMTGMYALSILMPVLWYSGGFYALSIFNPWGVLLLSVLVFGFFNFRNKARCFAGDVGSVSMGFLLIFLVLGLMFHKWTPDLNALNIESDTLIFDYKYILLLCIYGLDGVLTIVQRLYNKENIFKAHRKHLYQLLVNEKGWPHLKAAGLYALVQIMINVWVISYDVTFLQIVCFIVLFVLMYALIKYRILSGVKI